MHARKSLTVTEETLISIPRVDIGDRLFSEPLPRPFTGKGSLRERWVSKVSLTGTGLPVGGLQISSFFSQVPPRPVLKHATKGFFLQCILLRGKFLFKQTSGGRNEVESREKKAFRSDSFVQGRESSSLEVFSRYGPAPVPKSSGQQRGPSSGRNFPGFSPRPDRPSVFSSAPPFDLSRGGKKAPSPPAFQRFLPSQEDLDRDYKTSVLQTVRRGFLTKIGQRELSFHQAPTFPVWVRTKGR